MSKNNQRAPLLSGHSLASFLGHVILPHTTPTKHHSLEDALLHIAGDKREAASAPLRSWCFTYLWALLREDVSLGTLHWDVRLYSRSCCRLFTSWFSLFFCWLIISRLLAKVLNKVSRSGTIRRLKISHQETGIRTIPYIWPHAGVHTEFSGSSYSNSTRLNVLWFERQRTVHLKCIFLLWISCQFIQLAHLLQDVLFTGKVSLATTNGCI